jgi:hypothetical protein
MSVRAFFPGHNMSTEEVRLTAIHWAQIAIGAIYLLTAALIPFLIDQPMLERLVWAAVLGLLPGFCVIAACGRKKQDGFR